MAQYEAVALQSADACPQGVDNVQRIGPSQGAPSIGTVVHGRPQEWSSTTHLEPLQVATYENPQEFVYPHERVAGPQHVPSAGGPGGQSEPPNPLQSAGCESTNASDCDPPDTSDVSMPTMLSSSHEESSASASDGAVSMPDDVSASAPSKLEPATRPPQSESRTSANVSNGRAAVDDGGRAGLTCPRSRAFRRS